MWTSPFSRNRFSTTAWMTYFFHIRNNKDSRSHLDSPNFVAETEILRSAPLRLDFGFRGRTNAKLCQAGRGNWPPRRAYWPCHGSSQLTFKHLTDEWTITEATEHFLSRKLWNREGSKPSGATLLTYYHRQSPLISESHFQASLISESHFQASFFTCPLENAVKETKWTMQSVKTRTITVLT